MTDPLLFTGVCVRTFERRQLLTNASGFLFERDERLFLVTSRHVMADESSRHFPDGIEIELHVDANNMARSTGFFIPLYHNGRSVWRQGLDFGGEVDVAVIEIERSALPPTAVYRAFTPRHLAGPADSIEIGSALLVVCFPMGFHDTLHHVSVVRHAIVASAFGLRFAGKGYFLTDARMHRGTSGAPVVMRMADSDTPGNGLHWKLLGVHSARLDVGTRDFVLDDSLGLNCAWYADILNTLTE